VRDPGRMTSSSSAFRPRDVVLLLLLALIWGNSFLFIKLAVASLPPLWIVAIRMTLGGVFLVVVAVALRRDLSLGPGMLSDLGLIGIIGTGLPWLGQAWAQQFLESGLTAMLNSFTPVATLIVAVLAKQERLYRNRVLGLVVAMAGTLMIVRGEVHAGRSTAALATAVLATVGYAIGAVLTRARISGRVPALPASAIQLCLGALVLLPVAWGTSGPPRASLAPEVLGALLALGVLGTGVAFVIYFSLVQSVGATNASMVTYLVPFVGITAGVLVRGERFAPNVFAGGALLITGVWLAQRRPRGLEAQQSVTRT
jgi:drug/metabolite transporter (DMT)-like permease